MTSLLERPLGAATGNGAERYRLPIVPGRRKPLLAVASALLVLASVAVFASLYSSADHRVPVLTVISTIQQGAPITAAQLGTAEVASSQGLSPIPVSSASSLSGKWATVTIPAGSLLTQGDVTSNRPLPGGTAVVGLALKDGQLPSNGVVPGDRVMIVQTLNAGTVLPATSGLGTSGVAGNLNGASSAGVLVAQARVFETATPPTSSSSGAAELVSVTVPSTLASTVATAAAASEVSVVLLPAGLADSGTGPGSGSASGSP